MHWFAIAFLAPNNIVNIPLGVFKHVAGKDAAVETLVQIIFAVPPERGEKRLRKHTRRDSVDCGRAGREEYRIVWRLDSTERQAMVRQLSNR